MDFSYQVGYPEMDGDSAHDAPDSNEYPHQDKEILVIFEDDAEIAVEHISHVLADELSHMRTDLLYLGWCEGRLAKPPVHARIRSDPSRCEETDRSVGALWSRTRRAVRHDGEKQLDQLPHHGREWRSPPCQAKRDDV